MPQPSDARFDLGFREVVALYQAGRLGDAEAASERLVGAHPEAAAGYNILGVIQASRGNAADAAAAFGKAIVLAPNWDEARVNLGLAHSAGGDFPAAVENFRAALDLNPNNAAAAINLGTALREVGAREEACASYARALAIGGPEQARAQCNLGAVLTDLGKDAEALACFEAALARKPTYADAYLNKGRVLSRLGRRQEALASFERALECAPQSADAAGLLAAGLHEAGRLEEAAEAYRRTIALRPGDRQAFYHLGLVNLERGRHGEGLAAIARGPGILRFSRTAKQDRPPRRLALGGAGPNFIGAWMLDDPGICDSLIEFFQRQTVFHSAGRTGRGVDRTAKDSTDLTVMPSDLDKPGFEPVSAYCRTLETCYRDYMAQWPHLGEMLPRADVVPFTIQRYNEGGHFQEVHSERMTFGFIHRVLAWMTYLNDVESGGETRFAHYDLAVRPERGKTLIWPAEWTHAHAGAVVTAGQKYIITGWMHFPHEAATQSSFRDADI